MKNIIFLIKGLGLKCKIKIAFKKIMIVIMNGVKFKGFFVAFLKDRFKCGLFCLMKVLIFLKLFVFKNNLLVLKLI